ncbi:DUF4235 domain-containing protein [Brachybacterium squillarum]|uniref:DUF4235 domain-containing protein n=1 Tax=Brachybacterium squillarum TaxID=661979 RepID=UPI000262964E|nr:DUF4235 domain-containing protein [Brachybacterium squillarum]
MANPIVNIVVPLAGVAASVIGKKAAAAGWGAVFGEDAPTAKNTKASQKETAKRRKQARKDGASKAEAKEISDPMDETPVWKIALWTLISGVLLQSLRQLAQRGAKKGTEKMISRRPRSNRG